MRHFRSFRGSRRRGGLGTVIKSYKKVLNILEAGYGAGNREIVISLAKDSLSVGQTTNIDPDVPTGCIIKFIELQFSVTNVTAGNVYINTTFGYRLAGQSVKVATAIGGDPQRNQILHQAQFGIGANQNFTRTFRFKIPKQFQRQKEGMRLEFVWSNNESVNTQTQVIYKLYQ